MTDVPEEKLWEVRKLKLTQAVKALAQTYGPVTNAKQEYNIPNDPSSDLIIMVELGGNLIKLSCSLDGDPVFEKLKPETTDSVPIEKSTVRFEYEKLIAEVKTKIDSLLSVE